MSITTLHAATTSPTTGLVGLAGGLFEAFRNHLRIRRATAALNDLSPELLNDLGIDRSEIERVAKFGRRGA
jgi:uncharacterized protein YjiS (DUF1127 family)